MIDRTPPPDRDIADRDIADCGGVRDRLADLILWEDDPEAAGLLAAARHLEHCEACRAERGELAETLGALRGDVPTPRPGFEDALFARIGREVGRARTWRRLAAAASLLLAVGLGAIASHAASRPAASRVPAGAPTGVGAAAAAASPPSPGAGIQDDARAAAPTVSTAPLRPPLRLAPSASRDVRLAAFAIEASAVLHASADGGDALSAIGRARLARRLALEALALEPQFDDGREAAVRDVLREGARVLAAHAVAEDGVPGEATLARGREVADRLSALRVRLVLPAAAPAPTPEPDATDEVAAQTDEESSI